MGKRKIDKRYQSNSAIDFLKNQMVNIFPNFTVFYKKYQNVNSCVLWYFTALLSQLVYLGYIKKHIKST